jgi:hypothetical protein|tara:strand:- start:3317 stop:3826 length:510 start_codon:yes stop_codon:yes gene_type:complete
MRQVKINSTTGSEIVSSADLKLFAKIDTTADDAIIARQITQARIWCENYISRDIVAKNRSYYLDETNGIFDIPFGPVATISSIHADGVALTHTNIGLDKETIELDNGYAQKVTVVYITAGLDDSLLQQAILQLATTYYENRVDWISGASINEAPTDVRDVLNSYKAMFL